MKKMKFLFFLFLINLFFNNLIYTQGENNIWNVNFRKTIDFNTNPPSFIDTSNGFYSLGPGTTVCNANGNFLFYTDGVRVFNRFGEAMKNANANNRLKASSKATMPVLVVPNPNNKDQYYIFSMEGGYHSNRLNYEIGKLYYSILDMSLEGGNGDIIANEKNILLQENLTGRLISVKGNCGSVWVVLHEYGTNRFLAYEINEEGIQPPVISQVGAILNKTNSMIPIPYDGTMKISPNNKKIALFGGGEPIIELFDFDNATGRLSNPISLTNQAQISIINSGSFSPDSKKLYVTEYDFQQLNRLIYQFDISLKSVAEIDESISLITVNDYIIEYVNMEIGANDKIYIGGGSVIGAILEPNNIGSDVNFKDSVFSINDPLTPGIFLGLQNPIVIPTPPSISDSLLLPIDQQLCQNTQLTLQLQAEGDSYLWQDGSTTKDYEITTPGTYWVEVQKGNCTFTDTLKILPDDSFIDIGTDTTICAGTSLTLATSNKENTTYQWQDGSTNPGFTVSESGFYWVESIDSLCSYRDSIQVEIEAIAIDLPADTTICPDQNLLLNVAQTGVNFRWQDGSTQATFSTNEAGLYWVEAQKGDCSVRDSITLTYVERPTFLPKDTTLCNETNFLIYPNAPYEDVIWLETANIIDSLLVTASGIYRALFFGKCQWEDSITVDFQTAMLDLPADTTICAADGLLLDIGNTDGQLTWQDGSTDQQYLVTESGTYKASLTNENCTASDSIEVALAPLTLDLGQDTTLCEDKSLALTINVPSVNYEWQDGSNLSNLTITQSGVYWAKIVQDNCEAIDSITVNFTPSPIIDLGNDTTLCNGETLTLTAPNSIVTYEWQDGSQNPIFEVSNSDLYWLTGSINNCSSRDSILVSYENCEPLKNCQAYLPNSFSPNGDGINDELQLLTDCELQFFQMEVYDRWGSLIFSTDDVRQAWDGRYQGELLDTGVYLWTVEYQFLEAPKPTHIVETITVIR